LFWDLVVNGFHLISISGHEEGDMIPLAAIVPIIFIWWLVLPIHDHCPNILVLEINVRKLFELLVSSDLRGSHKVEPKIPYIYIYIHIYIYINI